MKHLVLKAVQNPLISGSAIIFIGSNAANIFNFLFNFFMVRNLSDADFGILTSLNSVILLPLLVATALMPIVVNFAAELFAKGRVDLVHGLYNKMAKYYFAACVLLLVVFIIATPTISDFFHIDSYQLIILTGIVTFIGLITTLNSAFLQAKLAFLYIAITSLITAILKFGSGVLLVLSGLGVMGGIWAVFIGLSSLFILSFIPIRFVFAKKVEESPIPTRELISYGLPSGVSILGLTSLISTDIFLVKHFFSPDEAGIYASISLVAKIIYFLTASIATVMFPVVVQKRTKGEGYHSTFFLAVVLVLIPSIIFSTVYFLIPETVISLVVKKESVIFYSWLLGVFGLLMSLYALVTLFTNFYLSIKKTIVAYPVLVAAILQGIIIWFYHDSFVQIVTNSLIIMVVLLLGLILYYPNATKK